MDIDIRHHWGCSSDRPIGAPWAASWSDGLWPDGNAHGSHWPILPVGRLGSQ